VRPWRLLAAACLAGWALLAWPALGWALGPFSHLLLARQLEPLAGVGPDGPEPLRQALYAGALAPDAGYYPGADEELADAAHHLDPGGFGRAMWELARTPEERAFAIGWLSHMALDLDGHGGLVNPIVGAAFSADPLNHKRAEWGLDCRVLARPDQAWQWDIKIASPAGLALWERALEKVHGARVGREPLERAFASLMNEVARLPYVFWRFGLLERPGHVWGNALGWAVGHSARPALVRLMEWHGGYVNERAVLGARRPSAPEETVWRDVLARAGRQVGQAVGGGPWPQGDLDVDPACAGEACPAAAAARAWLAGRR
jgi:hypothetical protein